MDDGAASAVALILASAALTLSAAPATIRLSSIAVALLAVAVSVRPSSVAVAFLAVAARCRFNLWKRDAQHSRTLVIEASLPSPVAMIAASDSSRPSWSLCRALSKC